MLMMRKEQAVDSPVDIVTVDLEQSEKQIKHWEGISWAYNENQLLVRF
jgi:hypothetical protein